jgi:hypothetical protein
MQIVAIMWGGGGLVVLRNPNTDNCRGPQSTADLKSQIYSQSLNILMLSGGTKPFLRMYVVDILSTLSINVRVSGGHSEHVVN